MAIESDSLIIYNALRSNTPIFIGRIAGVELQTAHDLLQGTVKTLAQHIKALENNAGIYVKYDGSLHSYATKLIESYNKCTHIAEWNGKVYEITGLSQEWIRRRTPRIPKITALALEPYYAENSWMPALFQKRILVIHPFVETFEKQVPKLNEIFPGRSWFEECSFVFLKPPVTLAGNHGNKDWEEQMDEFLPKLDPLEFDVALIAAGGYGMMISEYLYTKRNKSVMYIGGALQLFFGVIGRRWFDNPDIMKLVNDSWIRPAPSERPPNHKKVEKGCYW
jgi:hypothetical protein